MSSKKAFDLSRNSIYVANPDELRIVGGKSLLSGIERGPLDTDDNESHPLWDGDRLTETLSEEFIANIDAYGVIVPIVIAKDDETPTVVAGRSRVRAARIVNARRAKRGEPPITIECKMRRTDGIGLMGAMIAENEARRNDEVLAKMAKAKRMLSRGVGEPDVAATFAVSVETLKGWLAFEDNATAETKKAVSQGRVSATAAAELARVKDPEKQSVALTSLLTAPGKKTVTAARKAAANVNGKKKASGADGVGITSKRAIKSILDAVVGTPHPRAGAETLAWWQGVEDTLKLIVGEEIEPRLQAILDKVES